MAKAAHGWRKARSQILVVGVAAALLALAGGCDSSSSKASSAAPPTAKSTSPTIPDYRQAGNETVPTIKPPATEYQTTVVPAPRLALLDPMDAWRAQGVSEKNGEPYAGELSNDRPSTSVLATTNGGRSWSTILQPHGGVWTIDPVTTTVGYVIGTETAEVTNNGGRTWAPIAEPKSGPLVWAQFASTTIGFGLTTHNELVHTADGAQSWTTLPTPAPAVQACFTSPTTGYLINEAGAVYMTTDAGSTWRQAESAPAGVTQFQPQDPTIACGGTSVTVGVPLLCGAACGGSSHFTVLHSNDAGITWTSETDSQIAYDTDLSAIAGDANFYLAAVAPTENSVHDAPDGFGLFAARAPSPHLQRSTSPTYPTSTGAGSPSGPLNHVGPLSAAQLAVTGDEGWAVLGTTLWKTTNDGAAWTAFQP